MRLGTTDKIDEILTQDKFFLGFASGRHKIVNVA